MLFTLANEGIDDTSVSDVFTKLNIQTRADDPSLDNLKVWFYVAVGILGACIFILIGLVIGLFVWVSKIASSQAEIIKSSNRDRFEDYKISRPKLHGDAPYRRFTLPPKQEDGINSDIYYGGSNIKPEDKTQNSEPYFVGGGGRNPLSQSGSSLQKTSSYVDELKQNQNKSFNESSKRNDYMNSPYSPSGPGSDYYNNDRDRSKFQY